MKPTPEDLNKLRRLRREQGRKLREAERALGISAGDKNRLAAAERSRANSKQSAEIGTPPERDEERYERYRLNLFGYLCECFDETTGSTPLSLDHKRISQRLQEIMIGGGRDLFIMFRGFAKSTILENACTWCAGYGHSPFIVPLGATAVMARTALDSIEYEFETNDHLMQIFPAACFAARALEGIAQRARKQTMEARPTFIEWSAKRCVLPTYPGFEGSGSIIWPRSITSRSIRGMRFKRPDGKNARPTFIAGDDLQTDETAANPNSCQKILKTLTKTVMRLAGPRKTLAAAIMATVIEPDDAIDQLSDPKKYPQWRTLRVPMLKSFSKVHDEEWLTKYADIRASHNPEDEHDRARAERDCNAYYKKNRARMDEDCVPTWESCFDPEHELSAIQHAYNILIDDGEEAFMAECQSAPLKDAGALEVLTVDQFCNKQWDFARGSFPKETSVLTAFIDCHPGILYSEVWGYEPNFTGGRVDEINFPDQGRRHFGHRTIRRRLKHMFPGLDEEATLETGLDAFLHGCEFPDGSTWPGLMRMEWIREDGVPMRIRCCLVDANGIYRDAIVKVLSRSPFNANLHPSYGKGIGAKNAPIAAWPLARSQPGVGPGWCFTKPVPGEVQGIIFDTNFWKGRFHRGFALPKKAQGSLSLDKVKNATEHRMTGEHYSSEKGVDVSVDGRIVTEFTQKPNTDNHKLDDGVGSMVAASRCGITNLRGRKTAKSKKKKRRTSYG